MRRRQGVGAVGPARAAPARQKGERDARARRGRAPDRDASMDRPGGEALDIGLHRNAVGRTAIADAEVGEEGIGAVARHAEDRRCVAAEHEDQVLAVHHEAHTRRAEGAGLEGPLAVHADERNRDQSVVDTLAGVIAEVAEDP